MTSVVPYDSSWPRTFEGLRLSIEAALGERAIRIDHIGSTAVPGLSAKPIVDIELSVVDPGDEESYVPGLVAVGFTLRVREPGHRMLRTESRHAHLHVCAAGGDWERRHLLFRDWLRADEGDRRLYADTKLDLTARDWRDMNAYAEAKSEVIDAITERAERWAGATAWRPDDPT